MGNEGGRPVEILLAEDNPGDIRLTEEGLKESKIRNILNTVTNGVDVVEYLRKKGKFKDATRPDLILLDLNLPQKDGREVLAEIKEDKEFRRIPTVVITSSKAEEDVIKSYDLHANCYIQKPIDFDQFAKVVKSIEDFWFTIVKLPPSC